MTLTSQTEERKQGTLSLAHTQAKRRKQKGLTRSKKKARHFIKEVMVVAARKNNDKNRKATRNIFCTYCYLVVSRGGLLKLGDVIHAKCYQELKWQTIK